MLRGRHPCNVGPRKRSPLPLASLFAPSAFDRFGPHVHPSLMGLWVHGFSFGCRDNRVFRKLAA